jgi:hypothetical protein
MSNGETRQGSWYLGKGKIYIVEGYANKKDLTPFPLT